MHYQLSWTDAKRISVAHIGEDFDAAVSEFASFVDEHEGLAKAALTVFGATPEPLTLFGYTYADGWYLQSYRCPKCGGFHREDV